MLATSNTAATGSVLATPRQYQQTPTSTPHALTKTEIAESVRLYATAPRNAVEVHGANGFLIGQQFLNETSNNRTGEHGDSPENWGVSR
jgi:2,4-dienoyl-CoA reductase-like NADH-dependent reductase (Old Yellow Enzyme family)